ncbi:hypothetical protein E2562_019562 [Oryza meyeriana var. granulata]|uniref:Uncharacterized protein n=1 Tax=Oryza meyeriana var. granulata TaxID=110450 RepID=A0A6G1BZ25_9ORYZ|nr:hypothetical protein E2562_019562 [Oryza meyeriana var. granulata]
MTPTRTSFLALRLLQSRLSGAERQMWRHREERTCVLPASLVKNRAIMSPRMASGRLLMCSAPSYSAADGSSSSAAAGRSSASPISGAPDLLLFGRHHFVEALRFFAAIGACASVIRGRTQSRRRAPRPPLQPAPADCPLHGSVTDLDLPSWPTAGVWNGQRRHSLNDERGHRRPAAGGVRYGGE